MLWCEHQTIVIDSYTGVEVNWRIANYRVWHYVIRIVLIVMIYAGAKNIDLYHVIVLHCTLLWYYYISVMTCIIDITAKHFK